MHPLCAFYCKYKMMYMNMWEWCNTDLDSEASSFTKQIWSEGFIVKHQRSNVAKILLWNYKQNKVLSRTWFHTPAAVLMCGLCCFSLPCTNGCLDLHFNFRSTHANKHGFNNGTITKYFLVSWPFCGPRIFKQYYKKTIPKMWKCESLHRPAATEVLISTAQPQNILFSL